MSHTPRRRSMSLSAFQPAPIIKVADDSLDVDATPNSPVPTSNQSIEILKQQIDKKLELNKLQGPNIPFICQQTILKLQTNSASNIIKELKAILPEAQKKNLTKKILQLLDDLAVYFIAQSFGAADANANNLNNTLQDTNLSANVIQLLQVLVMFFNIADTDPKLLRYIHFFFSDLNFQGDSRGALLAKLNTEYQKNSVLSKLYAMKTLSRMVTKNDIYKKMISDIMSTHAAAEAVVQKKSLKMLLSLSVDKEKADRITILLATLQALRRTPSEIDASFIQHILILSRNRDAELAREAICTLAVLAEGSPALLLSLRAILPKFVFDEKKLGNWSYCSLQDMNTKDIKKEAYLPMMNAELPFGRCVIARLCGLIIPPLQTFVQKKELFKNSTPEKKAHDIANSVSPDEMPFITCLKHMLHDPELMVFFDAVKHCSIRSFSVFMDGDPKQPNIAIFNYVTKRLGHSLKMDNQLQVHIACRTAYYFLSSYQAFKQEFPALLSKNFTIQIQALYSKLDDLLSYDCPHVRLQAFKAMLWSEPMQLPQVLNRLKMEIKGVGAWMPFHYHELLQCLLNYSVVNKDVFIYFADFCQFFCVYCADRVNIDLLINLFKQICDYCEEGRIKEGFLKMIFQILDECMTGERESIDLIFSIYSFLGEYANRITREPSIASASASKKILTSPNLNPDSALTLDELRSRPEMFDIQNGAMKAIVLRLLQGSMYQTPQIRICCVEALAKIAFRSLDPIRLFVYSCIQYLASVENFGVAAQCSNILKVLDELYLLQQTFLKLSTREHDPQEALRFYVLHERIKEKIGFYCIFPPNFLPLGPKTRELLQKAYSLRQQLLQQQQK